MGAEQQVEGGVDHVAGQHAVRGDADRSATGLPLNGNMLDYRVPSIKDVPDNIEVYFVEKPKEYGVYGAHGLGEPPMGPPGRPSPTPSTTRSACGSTSFRLLASGSLAAVKQSAVKEDRRMKQFDLYEPTTRQRGRPAC